MSDSGQSASTAADEVDQELYDALTARLLRSGEWARLQTTLRRKLDEAGFSDDIYDLARERVRAAPAMRFEDLLGEVRGYGLKRLPEGVRQEVVGLLKDFLEKNLMGS